jgi:dihydroorotase
MKLLIKHAQIVDSSSTLNGSTKDILVTDGIISAISDSINEPADKIIHAAGLHVSIGWMDIFADFCDPGYEYKETIETGILAAASGGFTDVMIVPNTNPIVHSKSQVEYIIQKSAASPVQVHPIGSVTKNAEGKELSEMYDMSNFGAIAFSDGKNCIQSSGIVLKALQYVAAINGTIIQLPDDRSINPQGLINEGIISTQLGLPGKPAIAEELIIARDIELAKYCNSRIHFTGVSTKKGIELIQKAKSEGILLSCSVTPHHLSFCDEDLMNYDTNLKVNPPLRRKEDMIALREALKAGVIDCIASHHFPQNYDSKTCEFEYAKNGMIGLETMYGAVLQQGLSFEKFIQLQTINTRNIFGLPIPEIKKGATARLTLFDPEATFVFEKEMIRSKSANTPFIGKEMKGKVIGIVNGNFSHFN